MVIMLYRLVFFMSKGHQQAGRSPFIEPPWSEASVVLHYCESRPSGRCCCPWDTHRNNIKGYYVHKRDKRQYHPYTLPELPAPP